MNLFQQIKSKSKPPPPPPKKPSHLSPTTTASASTQVSTRSRKRGLGWPWDYPATLYPLFFPPDHHHHHHHDAVTWLFNWELWVPASLPTTTEWDPCVRTAGQCKDITPFLTDISTNQGRAITHFLGFNEPEIPSQAHMSVDQAVKLWTDSVLPAKHKFGFRLGSPGMSSDVSKSVPWLDEFLSKVPGGGPQLDFLVLHWYGPRFEDMRHFLELMHHRYKLPVWLNEFACSTMGGVAGGGSEASLDEVEAFLREAVAWLDACPWIERYAYFGNGQGMDVGTWVGRASNFLELAPAPAGDNQTDDRIADGRRLTKIGKLYLDV